MQKRPTIEPTLVFAASYGRTPDAALGEGGTARCPPRGARVPVCCNIEDPPRRGAAHTAAADAPAAVALLRMAASRGIKLASLCAYRAAAPPRAKPKACGIDAVLGLVRA